MRFIGEDGGSVPDLPTRKSQGGEKSLLDLGSVDPLVHALHRGVDRGADQLPRPVWKDPERSVSGPE